MTIHWITASKRTDAGTLACKVFFKRSTSEKLQPVEASWGMLPALWIGRVFKNRRAISGVHDFSKTKRIPVSAIADLKIVDAIAIPHSLYRLYDKEIFREFCVSFSYEGKTYFIPCIEVMCALYGTSTMLVHQLLTSGGLDDLIIHSTVKNNYPRKVEFDFSDQVSSINENIVYNFVQLYFNLTLRDGFKSVYTNYQKYGKIRCAIPASDSLELSVKCKKYGDTRFCSICHFWEFPLPAEAYYGPERLKKSHSSAEKGVISNDDSDEEAEIDPAGNPTQGGHTHTECMRSVNYDSSRDKCKITRKTRGVDTPKTKVISSKNADNSYSADEHTGDGTSKPFAFLGEDTSIPPAISFDASEYPLLGDILIALSQNRIPCIGIASGLVKGTQSFCYVLGQGRRRYEAAVVVFKKTRYLLLELQQDDFSASMLIMPTYSDDPRAEGMITQFYTYNGSWAEDGFRNNPHALLKHAKTRTPQRWAELIIEKMGTCS